MISAPATPQDTQQLRSITWDYRAGNKKQTNYRTNIAHLGAREDLFVVPPSRCLVSCYSVTLAKCFRMATRASCRRAIDDWIGIGRRTSEQLFGAIRSLNVRTRSLRQLFGSNWLTRQCGTNESRHWSESTMD